MSVLVVGISHRSAPLPLLERLAVDAEGALKLADDVRHAEHVGEVTVLATCNRVEIYAEVDRFHGSVERLTQLLCERSGVDPESVVPHLYVHYDDGAVSHLFRVTSGLDSMAAGEAQILGQTRDALRAAQEAGTVGPSLNELFQQALRVGKRTHAETDVDHAAPSLVAAGIARTEQVTGSLAGRRVLVVGAGALASLAVSTASAAEADLVVANRTADKGARLAAAYDARAVGLDALGAELAEADLVVCCTGATGVLLGVDDVRLARPAGSRPLAIVDLALPHDVEPAVADLDGVTLVSLATLADELDGGETGQALAQVRDIVAQEVAAFVSARRARSVTPTLVALRSMATTVVDAEIERLDARLPGLDEATRDEVLRTVRRVADKLLHQPTVRVKELADSGGASSYAEALAELFALDAATVDAVLSPKADS